MFQSQTRSRSTCDASTYVTPPARLLGFNLRREAAPHATSREERCQMPENVFQSQTRSRSTCDFVKRLCCQLSLHVSISDEKPLHMRHGAAYSECRQFTFQSQTRSRSTCDWRVIGLLSPFDRFQSQTRSRSTCDVAAQAAMQ